MKMKEFQGSVQTANIVQASNALLKMIADMKMAVVLQDASEIVEARNLELSRYADNANAKLCILQDEITSALGELETHYFASPYRFFNSAPE